MPGFNGTDEQSALPNRRSRAGQHLLEKALFRRRIYRRRGVFTGTAFRFRRPLTAGLERFIAHNNWIRVHLHLQ